MILKMASRNVWRNTRRTLITAATLAIGVAVVALFSSLANGMSQRLVLNTTSSRMGEAQLHATAYKATNDETLTIPNTPQVLKHARALPGVRVASPRALGAGMLSIADRSRGVNFIGIDPEVERLASNWDERISQGDYIDAPGQVMLGTYLAGKLDVKPGSKMVLTAANVHTGESTTELVRVKGLLRTGDLSIDRQSAIIHIDMAKKLMGIGQDVHEITLRLDAPDASQDTLAHIISPLSSDRVEARTWQQLSPLIDSIQALMVTYTRVMIFAIFLILAFGIVNTLSMSLLERMREFGVMRSLGTSGKQLAGMIVAEAALLGLIGCVPGVVVGLGLSALLSRYGFDFSGTSAYGMEFSEPIYGVFEVMPAIQAAVIFTVLTSLISLFTAYRAARLDPVEAMRR